VADSSSSPTSAKKSVQNFGSYGRQRPGKTAVSASTPFAYKNEVIEAVTARRRSAAFCTQSAVSKVSATGPCEPTQDRMARALTSQPTWCEMVSGEASEGPEFTFVSGQEGDVVRSAMRHLSGQKAVAPQAPHLHKR
jgi:hypothetical protein